MDREDSGSVRVLQTSSGPGVQQCLGLALCGPPTAEPMPGQYCLLGDGRQRWPCSYVSLPGATGRFIVTVHAARPLARPGERLAYSGPLGSAWPLPLQSTRLLAIARGEGVLTLLSALDEVRCWLPALQLRLLHDGFAPGKLPDECKTWFSALPRVPRTSSSGWLQLIHLLDTYRPDTVFCCAPSQVARQAARLCWRKGVSPQRIWLRPDQVQRPTWAGPVQRYDRVLAMLKWVPPDG
ncbi:hypothetical protein [Pseudomonas sp. B11(2017)]|uniref:hypothetical protein n=1 Tax=Pseudomonas sp. B11(2017) TaxID=1981748 RepID=UPI000A1DD4F2|nr:hypothetical protein [Pseudomonas sp. B11(2017)]